MLPSFLKVTLSASSLALGVFVSTLTVFCLPLIFKFKFEYLRSYSAFFICLVFVLIFFHTLISAWLGFNNFDSRQFFSIVFLSSLILSSFLFFLYVDKLSSQSIVSSCFFSVFFFVIVGLSSVFYRFPFLGYGAFDKAVFPFSEPSHFITTVAFVFIFCFVVSSNRLKVFFLSFFVVIAVLQPSMIALLYFLLMMFFLTFNLSLVQFSLLLLSVALLLIYMVGGGIIDVQYFASRLAFDTSTNNSTALVFMQGWEDSISTLTSKPFGLGFQNAIFVESGEFGERIFEVVGRYVNKDGAFLASKFIIEFGYLGVLICIMYMVLFGKSIFFVIKHIKSNAENLVLNDVKVAQLFYHSIIISFFFEMFVRGYGYFSPNVMLLIVAIVGLSFDRSKCNFKSFNHVTN